MPRKIFWAPEKINYIGDNLHLFSDAEFGFHFGVSVSAIKVLRLKNNILRENKRYYTVEDDKIIRELYPDTKTEIIAEKLNRTIIGIYGQAYKMGLKKSPEFLKTPECGILYPGHTRGKKTQFFKGQVPANKGKKMSAELKEKCKHTFFQKGHKPHNTLSDNDITIRHNYKRNTNYKHIRISEGNWESLARHNWEAKNGTIPKGFNVIFKDRDYSNCEPENLELISNAELLNRNSIHNYPPEIVKTILFRGALNRQINKLTKKSSNG